MSSTPVRRDHSRHALSILGITALVFAAVLAPHSVVQAGGLPDVPQDPCNDDEPSPSVVAGGGCPDGVGPCCHPCHYFTSFEAGEGFTAGAWMGDGNQGAINGPLYTWDSRCSLTNGSSIEGHIETANPLSGTQHLRLSRDPAVGTIPFGCIIDARVPTDAVAESNPTPIGPTTLSVNIAISDRFGPNYVLQPQAKAIGSRVTTLLFFYYGTVYVIEAPPPCNDCIPYFSWEPGDYHEYMVHLDPCEPYTCVGGDNEGSPCTTTYDCPDGACRGSYTISVDGELKYQGPLFAAEAVDQLLFFSDNSIAGNSEVNFDVDDINIARGDPCPLVCGDGLVREGEECEVGFDAACPGRCVPPGGTGASEEAECSCDDGPCAVSVDLPNGGPQVYDDHFGWWTFTADASAYAIETCGTLDYDSALSVWTGTCDSLTLIAQNDDCYDGPSFGAGSDPLASCFDDPDLAPSDPYNACLCIDTTPGQQYWVWDERVDFGDETVITLTKRLSCADNSSFGACCDPFVGCVDVASDADCPLDGTYHDRKTCASVGDQCASPTKGACCDRLTGTCTETTESGCTGNSTFSLGTQCTPGVCQPDKGACCVQTPFDALCSETKDVDCDGFFTPGADCAAVACTPEVIPTVSEWGLVLLALLLLVGAKVLFRHRGDDVPDRA